MDFIVADLLLIFDISLVIVKYLQIETNRKNYQYGGKRSLFEDPCGYIKLLNDIKRSLEMNKLEIKLRMAD